MSGREKGDEFAKAAIRRDLLGLFGSFLEYTPEREPVRPDTPGKPSK